MFSIIITLLGCAPSTEEVGSLAVLEVEIAFEDRNGVIQAPDGEILGAAECYEAEGILMCAPTSWGTDERGLLHITISTPERVGVVKYITIQ